MAGACLRRGQSCSTLFYGASHLTSSLLKVLYSGDEDGFIGGHEARLKQLHVLLDERGQERIILHDHIRIEDEAKNCYTTSSYLDTEGVMLRVLGAVDLAVDSRESLPEDGCCCFSSSSSLVVTVAFLRIGL